MGIQGLHRLIADTAPGAIKEGKIDSLFGRKIAIDASMAIYQFLIAVRQAGGEGQLTNDAGEVTSHLTGILYRTIRMMEAGIKPVFVFDGKPPTLKGGQLAKRKERQQAAQEELAKLQAQGDASVEDIERQQKRTVRASREQSEEVKKLLKLMGVPVVDAPCEAEATCAALAKAGVVYGAGTEDMDALTFGTPILVRHLNVSESRKLPILEIDLEKVLAGMELTHDQFVDLCILCGCDYADSIKGIGPKTAIELIRKHKSMEGVLKALELKKTVIPDPFPYEEARELFNKPEVTDPAECPLKWTEPDQARPPPPSTLPAGSRRPAALPPRRPSTSRSPQAGLIAYLVDEKQFAADRVTKAIERLKARAHHAARMQHACGTHAAHMQHACSTHAARSAHAPSRARAADSRSFHARPPPGVQGEELSESS